ncbi:hypothetical protein EHI8A_173340 [Entamoeba histolytica HM-1:IMSS-B]|uniref:DNA-directed RNA polymerase III subunit RPC6 n=6 Tax=Entamoeba histolytica TaxID=5759 RepID=C4MBG5_ENTH1|nr:hypothetical protein EHI_147230 [Entamoeba histolytica HM-1:IMSS]EMD46301.1 Hypothetical protein EHI5A_156760 [Entamoeba histolytica KU27]EMH77996.1 hypothetical protein EHI8A_173340 [Entamoeba histolytica HM-1:IMSS-B]EMS10990.1 hypothetical protein KM1_205710 [Entamoeba histolytica HM-3:IMSS]ENY63694.1 hypothetical protein EHI7A_116130 [Entamoeba histolytica HM-1:IMSS-A]GAT99337.1 hypothetical protein CL6EHI_147230 [Entamoeba histolytica]|eukprot:XP_649674.1 hypothetical protein EHI_147230 [Entamoeba histolytica HM-1:IMSS]
MKAKGTKKQIVEKKNVFFTKTGLDADFVTTLSDHIFMFLLNKGGATVIETYDYVRESGISNVDIKKEEILSLLERLVYLGNAEVSVAKNSNSSLYGSKVFKPVKFMVGRCPLSEVPCYNCPYSSICSPTNVSCNPRNCKAFVDLLKVPDDL